MVVSAGGARDGICRELVRLAEAQAMTTTNSQTRDEQSAAVGLLRVLRRRMAIIIVCAIAVPAGALVFSLFQENQYSASASLLFRDPQFDQKLFGNTVVPANLDPSREAATNVEL